MMPDVLDYASLFVVWMGRSDEVEVYTLSKGLRGDMSLEVRAL